MNLHERPSPLSYHGATGRHSAKAWLWDAVPFSSPPNAGMIIKRFWVNHEVIGSVTWYTLRMWPTERKAHRDDLCTHDVLALPTLLLTFPEQRPHDHLYQDPSMQKRSSYTLEQIPLQRAAHSEQSPQNSDPHLLHLPTSR